MAIKPIFIETIICTTNYFKNSEFNGFVAGYFFVCLFVFVFVMKLVSFLHNTGKFTLPMFFIRI